MPAGKFVSYLRVSTERQGKSGLGLDAQRAAVREWLNGGNWSVLAEYVEVESGKNDDRPQLAAAMAQCRLTGARLVIAKLDRLSRDASFLIGLEKAGIDFVAADMPNANRMTIGIMALVAQQEREAISTRTKAALAVASARRAAAGEKPLGGYRGGAKVDPAAGRAALAARRAAFRASVQPIAAEMRAAGMSLRQIAAELEVRGIQTFSAGYKPRASSKKPRPATAWSAVTVSEILA